MEEQDSIAVELNLRAFKLMQQGSEDLFSKKIDALNFDEASKLVGGVVMAIAASHKGRITNHDGSVLVDSEADGLEAFEGYGRQKTKELAPQIDDERELVISVVRDKTIWDAVRGRKPKVEQEFRFRNEPPQYA